jgi:hypothetical protein
MLLDEELSPEKHSGRVGGTHGAIIGRHSTTAILTSGASTRSSGRQSDSMVGEARRDVRLYKSAGSFRAHTAHTCIRLGTRLSSELSRRRALRGYHR